MNGIVGMDKGGEGSDGKKVVLPRGLTITPGPAVVKTTDFIINQVRCKFLLFKV